MKTLYIENPYPLEDARRVESVSTSRVIIAITNMQAVVSIGEEVTKGQVIATGNEYAHASITGVVTDITPHAFPHPSGLATECIIIEYSGEESLAEITYDAYPNYQEISQNTLIQYLRTSGIVGLGGAGFSTHSKLERFIQNNSQIEDTTLLINATECEPAVRADYALTLTYPKEIIIGALILGYIAGISKIIIAVEDTNPELKEVLNETLTETFTETLTETHMSEHITISEVPSFYASGAEKVLIKEVLGIDIASNEFAVERGILSYNVATIKAVHDYIILGKALTERIVTLTGEFEHPRNVVVPIGTPISALISPTPAGEEGHLRTNGIMMGIDIQDSDAPILKTTNMVIHSSQPLQSEVSECIKCSGCVPVCPEGLLPQQLYFFIKGDNIPKAQSYRLADCILCRCCDEVCPSNIPLSEYFRLGKAKTKEQERKQALAEQSKQRFEFRQYRLERNKQEREEMMARKREAAKAKLAKMQQERNE